jgi:hypothetical protein
VEGFVVEQWVTRSRMPTFYFGSDLGRLVIDYNWFGLYMETDEVPD